MEVMAVASSRVSTRGQAVIPAEIRRRYGLKRDSRIEWVDIGNAILVIPQDKDVIEGSFGMLRESKLSVNDLLLAREEDKKKEKAKVERM